MASRLCNQQLTVVLIQLMAVVAAAASTATVSAPEDRESRILASVVGPPEIQSGIKVSDWRIVSEEIQTRIIGSEMLSSDPEPLFVFDAARLTQSDFQQGRSWADQALEATGQDPRIAWVDDEGWEWVLPSSLPSMLPAYAEKPRDSFEAAVFLGWLREIITAKSEGTPLRIVVFTQDFPVSEFRPDWLSVTGSLPRQSFNSFIACSRISSNS